MTFLKSDARGTTELSIGALELNKRIIILKGDIDTESANIFIQKIIAMLLDDKVKPIKVLITSSGGSVDAGMLIVDCLKSINVPVYTYVLEKAYSMGAIISAVGTKAYILQNSKIMIHKPWVTASSGTADDLLTHAKTLKQYEEMLIKVLMERTKKDKKVIQKAIQYDHFFTSEEAFDYGLVDGIVGINHILESEV